MKVSTHYKFKFQNQEKQSVLVIFPTEVELSVETVTKSLFSTGYKLKSLRVLILLELRLVAEVGGFLGMILGVSLLDLEVLIKLLLSVSQDKKQRCQFQ